MASQSPTTDPGGVTSDALDLLLSRRSTLAKDLIGPGPSDAQLKGILTAGLRVPDHGKLWPWRVQVLRESGQAALGAFLAERFAAEHPDAEARQVEIERERPTRAPLLLVVSSRVRRDHKVPVSEQVLSGGAVCQNLINAAHASGFAAQWLTEWPAYDAGARRFLGIPEDQEILGLIYLGTPPEPPRERPRPTLADVVTLWEGPGAETPFG